MILERRSLYAARRFRAESGPFVFPSEYVNSAASVAGDSIWHCCPPLSLSETHARIYWWCSPPKIGTANV
jgi:hypothetical protein